MSKHRLRPNKNNNYKVTRLKVYPSPKTVKTLLDIIYALAICKILSKIKQYYKLLNKTIKTEYIFTLRYIQHTSCIITLNFIRANTLRIKI